MNGRIRDSKRHRRKDYRRCQRVEHYENSSHGTVIAHAKLLGESQIVELLSATLSEEKATDKKTWGDRQGYKSICD